MSDLQKKTIGGGQSLLKRTICLVMSLIILATSIEFNKIEANAIGTFNVTLTANTDGYGSVSLDWSSYNYTNKNFKVYKSSDGVTYETVGVDYTLVDEVKCLHVYPATGAANKLETWMETNGYGKGIIKVDPVAWNNFNNKPYDYLKDSSGNWQYDVVFFGTWDSNNSKDLNNTSRDALEAYLKTGRGCIIGHDIFRSTLTPKLIQLKDYFGISVNSSTTPRYYGVNGDTSSYTGGYNRDTTKSQILLTKKGLLTNYPWELWGDNVILEVPLCHTNTQHIDKGTIWARFYANSYSSSDYTNKDNSYISTYNNTALIQTGHSYGNATVDEQKILANLIFYMNQLLFNTYRSKDSSAQDLANPNAPSVSISSSNNFNFSATDNGSTYWYYVEAYSKDDTTADGLLDRSGTKSLTVTTGVKSYRYIYNNNASTTVTLSNGTSTTSSSIPIDSNYSYIHVAAVDGAGNIGPTTDKAVHVHSYTSSITTQPTCTAKGLRTYTCSGCGHTYTEDIDALGHLHPDNYSYEDNNGVTEGLKYKKCQRCGIYLEKLYRVLLNRGTGIDSVSGENYYTEGANVSIDATVNQHYNWSNWTGTTTYSNKNTSFSMPSNAVSLTANATPKNYYLDLNGYLDGKYVGNITDYGTADIYIDNTLKADNVSDYYTAHPYPSTYEIKDIQATAKHRYKGLYSTSDSLSGTLDGDKSIILKFNTVYTITYDGNNETSGNTESQEFEHGESVQLRENEYKKDSYEFDSWNTTAKGDGTKYLPGQTYSTCADLKLYAKWKRTFSLTFDMNGGQYKGKSDNVVLKGTVYNDNKEYTFKIKNDEATEASYPDWDAQDGTIDAYGKYDANGINNSYAKTINSVPCRFLGWSLDKNATEPDDGLWVYRENLSELTIKDDTTLYAIWEPILQCKVDLRRSLGDIQFDYGPVNTTGVINAISTSKRLVALIKPGEQGQYEIISSNSNVKVDITFDSKMTDIYDNNSGIWTDTLNPWTPESSESAKCGLNRHIEGKSYILRKFNMPLYIGTNMSYVTSIGVKEYTVQFIITQESKFHTSGERIIVNGKIYITDKLAEGEEPDTVLDELRTRLKIRIK